MKNYILLTIFLLAIIANSFSIASPKSEHLIEAIAKKDINRIEQLVRNGVDLNQGILMYNTSPLMFAVETGSKLIVSKLIEHGSYVDTVDHLGNTPLIKSIEENRDEIATILIQNSTDINIRTNIGSIALHHAAKQSNETLFEMILEKGGDLNAYDDYGNTTLFYAMAGRNKQIINKLIKMNNFDLSHKNYTGQNAYKVANRYGLKNVAKRISRGRN